MAAPELTGAAPGARKAGGVAAGLVGATALILSAVLNVEGGFVDHKDDPGGVTNLGLTEPVARQCGWRGPMSAITREFAFECYNRMFVTKPGFDGVIAQSVALGEEVVDQGVNFGPKRPSCYLQTALNALNRGQADYADLKVDCSVGRATNAAFAALAKKRGNRRACELVLKLMDAQQGAEYLRLAKANPKLESFMVGWADHRLGNVPIETCAKGGAG